MDVFSEQQLLVPLGPKNPQEARDASCGARIGDFGQPECIRMDEGGGWKHEVLADLCSERAIKVQFRGAGARPWILERRNGLARGTFNRLAADGRSSGKQVISKVQCCLNTLISGGGYSAYQLAFGSNPVGLFGWNYKDEDLLSAQDT